MYQRYILKKLIHNALEEDVGPGDITTWSVLFGEEKGVARAIAKTDLTVAGLTVFEEVFFALDPGIHCIRYFDDGSSVTCGQVLAQISGKLVSILTAERVALNFLQRMCGIATLTRKFVDAIEGTGAKILDTRKTAPGLRYLDKYAVRMGGGYNHRFGLYDGILIKDNHIVAAGGISRAIERVRMTTPHTLKVEVEAKNLAEVEEALKSGADIIMLDNMTVADMRKAVALVQGKIPLEASGNVTLENVREIAETGVDFISVGMLTHSVPAADISLLCVE